jgi:hypothetical protein
MLIAWGTGVAIVYSVIFITVGRMFKAEKHCEHRFLNPPTKVVKTADGRTMQLVTTSEAWRCASCGVKVEPPRAGLISNGPSDRRKRMK